MKKGELHWDELGKAIMALILLVIAAIIIWLLRTKLSSLISKIGIGV
ncbi:hypothetical protein J4455_01055 [Candidatus Woesearchaeota archaeon]|nr:hypothetical protein [Candidatus Woesearchaeota archaeon]